jgi:hypothetical protein
VSVSVSEFARSILEACPSVEVHFSDFTNENEKINTSSMLDALYFFWATSTTYVRIIRIDGAGHIRSSINIVS